MEIQSKSSIALVIVTLAVGLGLGMFQIVRGIQNPFRNAERNSPALENERAELIALQGKDTDQDGLNDFDELYAFQTSPYLPDSDSDGIPDAAELDADSDPNCPEGRICRSEPTNTNIDTSLTNLFNINSPEGQALTNAVNGNANTNTTVVNPSVDQVTTEQLREALKKSGAPAETVDKLDEATLRRLYAEALAEENQSNITNTNSSAGSNANSNLSNQALANVTELLPENLEELKNLSASEIRKLLVATGVPSDTLEEIDDSLLKDIFLQAIDEEL